MAKFKPPNAGKGRGRGNLNKSTRIIKLALAQFVANNVVGAQVLFDRVAQQDPEAALALLAKFAEFVLPRNAHLTAEIGRPIAPPQLGISFANGGPGLPRVHRTPRGSDDQAAENAATVHPRVGD